MKIRPREDYILLETYEVPREPGKILLPNAPKDTQIYKIISINDEYSHLKESLVYLKSHPRSITQGDKVSYIAELEEIIAVIDKDE